MQNLLNVMAANPNFDPATSLKGKSGMSKSYDILTCTTKAPQFSYAHLELISDLPKASVQLDNLQVKSYCTAALRQFLGVTGLAISLDILKVSGTECWIRVPREDLAAFAAAITAWKGTREGDEQYLLRIKQCSDFLGMMVGSDGQDQLWNS